MQWTDQDYVPETTELFLAKELQVIGPGACQCWPRVPQQCEHFKQNVMIGSGVNDRMI
jgi:hypothetical protein